MVQQGQEMAQIRLHKVPSRKAHCSSKSPTYDDLRMLRGVSLRGLFLLQQTRYKQTRKIASFADPEKGQFLASVIKTVGRKQLLQPLH